MVMETERYILDEKGVLTFKDDVTMIKEEEFKGRDDIKKVILPGTVDSIGNFAFCGCKALREVVMEEGVRWIWDGAFRGNSTSGIVGVYLLIRLCVQHRIEKSRHPLKYLDL